MFFFCSASVTKNKTKKNTPTEPRAEVLHRLGRIATNLSSRTAAEKNVMQAGAAGLGALRLPVHLFSWKTTGGLYFGTAFVSKKRRVASVAGHVSPALEG